jgi:Fe2+ or Zn2+ uptake regulation protein
VVAGLGLVYLAKHLIAAKQAFKRWASRWREKYPNVSLGTVYRNLQNFSMMGQVRRTLLADGKARFELAGNIHHHHLICLTCGETSEVPWCPVGAEVLSFMTECDFTPVSHQFEIYGYCHKCYMKKPEGVDGK